MSAGPVMSGLAGDLGRGFSHLTRSLYLFVGVNTSDRVVV